MSLTFACSHKRRARVKRIFNFSLSLIALVLLAPVFIFTCIIIKLTSKGPVFFKQERIGKNFRSFQIYKFRTVEIQTEVNSQTPFLRITRIDDSFVHASSTGFLNY